MRQTQFIELHESFVDCTDVLNHLPEFMLLLDIQSWKG